MLSNHIEEQQGEFQKTLDHFQKDLQSLRTGRASAGLVEGILIEAYEQRMELKSVASITIPDAKTIQIEPWDKSIVKEVEKALVDASLGMQPTVAGTVIRLVMPLLTEETRKQLVKVLHQKAEAARICIRNVREKIKSLIVNDEKEKIISEDERHHLLERLEKIVSEWNYKVDAATEIKEKDIMSV